MTSNNKYLLYNRIRNASTVCKVLAKVAFLSEGLIGKDLCLSSLIQLLADFTSLWAVGQGFHQFLTPGPLHRASYGLIICFLRASKRGINSKRERVSKGYTRQKSWSCVSHHAPSLFLILFTRTKPLGTTNTQKEQLLQRHEH